MKYVAFKTIINDYYKAPLHHAINSMNYLLTNALKIVRNKAMLSIFAE